MPAIVCPTWGDTSLWGDGDLWCGSSGVALQYIAWVEGNEIAPLAVWNLTVPSTLLLAEDGTSLLDELGMQLYVENIGLGAVVTFSISTSGVTSWQDSNNTPLPVPVVPSPGTTVWRPSVDVNGFIYLTSETYNGTDSAASLIDSNGVEWFWTVPDATLGISEWNNRQTIGVSVKLHYISTQVTYSGGDDLVIDRITPLINVVAQQPGGHIARTDFSTHKRISVQIVSADGVDFKIDRISILASVKQHQPKG